MINGDITVKGNNGMVKALIISSLIMGLLMGVTVMTLAYGEPFQLTEERADRLVSIQDDHWILKCPNMDKEYGIWMGHSKMSEAYFTEWENVACEKTPQQILDESAERFDDYITDLEDRSDNG